MPEQAEALTAGGVDFLLLETFFALEEATAAIEGVKQASKLPLIVSFSYDQGTRTMMGLRPAQVVEAIAPLGVAAIGANCGKALDTMVTVLDEMLAARAGLPIWIKPNAGLPRMIGDVAAYDLTPEQMAEYAARFVRAGAQIVGGCCGSSPAHVAAIARAVRSLRLLRRNWLRPVPEARTWQYGAAEPGLPGRVKTRSEAGGALQTRRRDGISKSPGAAALRRTRV